VSLAYAAVIFDEDLAIVGVLPPRMTDYALQVSGFTTTSSAVCDTFTGGGGCVHFDTQNTEFQAVVNFETAPGTKYVQLKAHAHRNAVAVADPVIEPHPDNPEVVVTMRGMALPPIPGPFAGVTPEDLAARGIDPGPFVRLGFFDPPAPADSAPPSTLATPQPGPNASGWNNAPVTVDLAAADNAGGTGVKEIRWALSGASTGSHVVAGSNAGVVISAEGQTTLTYFAVDQANNQEAPKALTIQIDRTPPAIAGLPAASCVLWPPSHRLVPVATLSASDGLSGLAAGSPTVAAVSSEPVVGPGDATAPDIVISGDTVQLRAERAGNGTGRTYTLTARATDLAGNEVTTSGTCTVPHDRGKR
jgi:hypothetical protein